MDIPCPDERHAFKMEAYPNKCDTCFGRGIVWQGRKQRITIISGPEAEVFRAEDLEG